VGTPTAVEQTLSVNDWMNRAAASIEAEADHLTQLTRRSATATTG